MTELIDWNDRYATSKTPWDSGSHSKELERILNETSLKPGRTLEIGCGTGTNAIFLARRGFSVTAIDLSPLAIDQAAAKAKAAGHKIDFKVADILTANIGAPFDFVFDRGVYHHLRSVNLFGFLTALARCTVPGGHYLTLAGNANDRQSLPQEGPPVVRTVEICTELSSLFDLVQLREFTFDGVVVDGKPIAPLAWSALFRRR